jgi:hypothetical protein
VTGSLSLPVILNGLLIHVFGVGIPSALFARRGGAEGGSTAHFPTLKTDEVRLRRNLRAVSWLFGADRCTIVWRAVLLREPALKLLVFFLLLRQFPLALSVLEVLSSHYASFYLNRCVGGPLR